MEHQLKRIRMIVCLGVITVSFLITVCSVVSNKTENVKRNNLISWLTKNISIHTEVEDKKWMLRYPFPNNKLERLSYRINLVENVAEEYCTNSSAVRDEAHNIATTFNKLYNYDINSITEVNNEIEFIKNAENNVVKLSKQMNEKGIPFLYVQAPSNGAYDYYNGHDIDGYDLLLAERGVFMVDCLREDKIDLLNIIDEIDGPIDYDASRHWMPENSLDATKLIIGRMNSDYGFNIDLDAYDEDCFVNLMDSHQDRAKELKELYGYDYNLPIPKKDYHFKWTYAEEEVAEGDFEHTVLKDESNWWMSGWAYHNIFNINNSTVHEIVNYDADNDYKILVIGDSYNWPVSSYLAIGVRQVNVIYLDGFSGSLISYINAIDPDMVMIVYADIEMENSKIDKAYDLR